MGEEGQLDGIEPPGLAADREGADDPFTHPEALGHGPALAVALGAAGQAPAGDGGVGGVDHDPGHGARGRQGGAHAIHEADEEALAPMGGLDGPLESVIQEADGIVARDQSPQDVLEVFGLLVSHDPNIGR